MRYVYCKECKQPISVVSTFEEAVIRGVQHKKKLKDTCGISKPFCLECLLKLKPDDICNHQFCRKMKDGKCLFKNHSLPSQNHEELS